MPRKKGKRPLPPKKKIEMIGTTFFTAPASENALCTDCFNTLTILATSKAYPELAALAPEGLALVQVYKSLVDKSASNEASAKVTDEKAEARFNLVYFMYKIAWGILFGGKNDIEKMTGDTGFFPIPERSGGGPILVAPRAKYGLAVPDNPNLGTYALPITFLKGETPKRIRGSSYRLRMDGATAWDEAVDFADNRNRSIGGLKLGDKGKYQVRYNGGSNANGPWSDEMLFVVAA